MLLSALVLRHARKRGLGVAIGAVGYLCAQDVCITVAKARTAPHVWRELDLSVRRACLAAPLAGATRPLAALAARKLYCCRPTCSSCHVRMAHLTPRTYAARRGRCGA